MESIITITGQPTMTDLKEMPTMNFIKIAILFCFSSLSLSVFSQVKSDSTFHKVEIGPELQFYPAGYIIAISSNIFIKESLAIRLKVGGNFADREGFSDYNDEEKAKGFGGGIGLVKYFPYKKGNFIAGIEVDVWNMWTDWKDEVDSSNPQSGTTYNLVVQPWLNAGYLYNVSENLNVGLTLGVGREINVITNGEAVGEGWIGLLSFVANFSLKK